MWPDKGKCEETVPVMYFTWTQDSPTQETDPGRPRNHTQEKDIITIRHEESFIRTSTRTVSDALTSIRTLSHAIRT